MAYEDDRDKKNALDRSLRGVSDEDTSKAIKQYAQQQQNLLISGIEEGNTSLDSNPLSSTRALSKALSRPLPGSPTTAKRYHTLYFGPSQETVINNTDAFGSSSTNHNYQTFGYMFKINKKNAFDPSGHDEVINIEDVSGGAPYPGTILNSGGNNDMHLIFPAVDYSNARKVCKSILVTWLSGYTKTFNFCSVNNNISPGPVTYGTQGAGIPECSGCMNGFTDKDQYEVLHQSTAATRATLALPVSTYTISNPMQNPFGHLQQREYWAEQAPTGAGYNGGGSHGSNQYLSFQNKSHHTGNPNTAVQHMIPHVQSSAEQYIEFTHKVVWDKATAILKGFDEIKNKTDLVAHTNSFSSSNKKWSTQGMGDPNYYQTPANSTELFADGASFRVSEDTKGNFGGYYMTGTYADNLAPCPTIAAPTYTVCIDPSAPDFYQTTCLDCAGVPIPLGDCNGSNGATFIDGQCCTPCNLDVILQFGLSGWQTQNGYIIWDTNPLFGASPGVPFSSGSQYTAVVTASNGASLPPQPPAGGNSFTVNVTTVSGSNIVTVPSNAQISPGMSITVPGNTQIPAGCIVSNASTGNINQNLTAFTISDAAGNPVAATAGATVVGTFAVGSWNKFGNLLPNNAWGLGAGTFYTLTVTDSDGCVDSHVFTIGMTPPSTGCTDSTALNYNAGYNQMCTPPCCITCNATTGQLEDPLGTVQGNLFTGNTTGIVDATVNGSNVPQSDGQISLTANMMNAAAFYLETDGTQSYTFTIYDLATQGDPTSIISTIATQAGLAVNTFGGAPNHSFSNLAYGHYAIKVELIDNDEAHGLEPCFQYFFATVKVPICDDITATNYNSSNVPTAFAISQPNLCTYPQSCCTLAAILEDTTVRGTPCAPFLFSEVQCDPAATNVQGSWLLNGTIITGSGFNVGAVGNSPTLLWLMNSSQTSLLTTSGTYTVQITSTYANGTTCSVNAQYIYTQVICGCTDPTALNYNPLATIDDGTCVYPSWNCISGLCIDPGDGSGVYNSGNGGLAGCQANCIPITPGCTDPCATNYNPAATIDDGSCTYSACLDPAASNQYWSCACNSVKPLATIPDPACCTYPCATPPNVVENITVSSGTCVIPITDGDVDITATLSNGASTYTIAYYDFTYTTLLCTDPNTYTSGATSNLYSVACGVGLAAGNYLVEITDTLGCVYTQIFTIGTLSQTQGCTDPTAQNYNPLATCDDGSCVYCGCRDPLANNYNPNAVCDDGTCDYTIPQNPCVPPNIDRRIQEIVACLSEKGTTWLNKYRIGTADDCTIMNKWKLILILYLLKNKGLTCLYNCADTDSPSVTSLQTCANTAAVGGPNTGLNDQGFAGSSYAAATGTTIVTPASYFVPGNTLQFGDVITMPGGLVYTVVIPGGCTSGCYDPQTSLGMTSGHWTQCVPGNNITITNSTNYLDNFINFANKYCRDCKIDLLGNAN